MTFPFLHPFKTPGLRPLLGFSLGFSIVFAAQADSSRTFWSGNNHYYQRIDNSSITWSNAKFGCQVLGAHLATITSGAEQAFVYALVKAAPAGGAYALGAGDAATEKLWQWINGEGWSYSNWEAKQPDNAGNEDYLAMFTSNGKWNDENEWGYHRQGYVCEWDSNIYVGTAKVPDQNSNGYPEDAMLYVDLASNVHTVVVRDRKPPHATVGPRLTFGQNLNPPKGVGLLADTNGNGRPEIAVLDLDYNTNVPVVRVKDVSSNQSYVRVLRFFIGGMHRPVSLAVEPDSNFNGSSELTVSAVRIDTGKAYTETRDSRTGALLYSNVF